MPFTKPPVISTKQKSEGVRRERNTAPLNDWNAGEAAGLEQVVDCQLKRNIQLAGLL